MFTIDIFFFFITSNKGKNVHVLSIKCVTHFIVNVSDNKSGDEKVFFFSLQFTSQHRDFFFQSKRAIVKGNCTI